MADLAESKPGHALKKVSYKLNAISFPTAVTEGMCCG